MLLKESNRVLSLCPSLPVSGAGSPISCITSSCPGASQRPPRARLDPYRHPQRWDVKYTPRPTQAHSSARCYASVSAPPPKPPPKPPPGAAPGYTWPASLHPTPYEILAHPRHARYNKALFYELVKIYHPDRNRSAVNSAISQSTRLERYRLVVAANEILSDEARRRAYDLYGAGWDGNRTLQSPCRESYRSWRNEPGNASGNATWEDWERWRRERNGGQQSQAPVFMSNEVFVIVLCSFVVLGSFTQARRASASTLDVVEMRDQKDAAISNEIRRRQDEKAPLNRHERIENFLRQRDSWNLVSSDGCSPESPP
ncbi:putative J domain-containing protein [Rosellinia necatrix]|uniref:Putative J domain-containing protein n=1 Tax=Rosellinia necatrix TaxID=77044 RepID=A0A1W2TQA6_ROSNE|nr:putative J domain-containing protein [Rosellinia necatrix]